MRVSGPLPEGVQRGTFADFYDLGSIWGVSWDTFCTLLASFFQSGFPDNLRSCGGPGGRWQKCPDRGRGDSLSGHLSSKCSARNFIRLAAGLRPGMGDLDPCRRSPLLVGRWLVGLLAAGLLAGSLIPSRP